jgi:hypothetical protein
MIRKLKRLFGTPTPTPAFSSWVDNILEWVKDKSMSRCTNDNCSVLWVYTYNELGGRRKNEIDYVERWVNQIVNCPNCRQPLYFWRGRHDNDWVRANGRGNCDN